MKKLNDIMLIALKMSENARVNIMDNKCEMVIEALVSKLTLDEKISMLHGTGLFHNGGVERLGIPELVMSDGPMGVRNDFEDAHWMVKRRNFRRLSLLR